VDEKGNRSYLTWLAVGTLMLWAVVALVIPPETITKVIDSERHMYARHLGPTAEGVIRGHADRWFTDLAIDSGFRDATYNFMIGRHAEGESKGPKIDDRGLSQYTMRQLQSTWGAVYQAMYRIAGLMSWIPYLIPIVAAMIFDGICQWQIRQWRFSYASQTVHGYSARFMLVILFGCLTIPVLPVSITPWFAPLFIVSASTAGWVMAANMIKRF
jgi:hypothetical protein